MSRRHEAVKRLNPSALLIVALIAMFGLGYYSHAYA
jgi:hypothetical protein